MTADLTDILGSSRADAAFIARIHHVVDLAGGIAALSRKCRMSRAIIHKYLNGESDPSRVRLVALARGVGVGVEWLATGEGRASPGEGDLPSAAANAREPVDSRLLALVHRGVLRIYVEEGVPLHADSFAEEVARIYADLAAAYDSRDERPIGLKALLQHLRRQIRGSASGAAEGS